MKPRPGAVRTEWIVIGWLGVALLVYLSLMRDPPSIAVEQGDKIGHFAAYGTLMLWFAQLATSLPRRALSALALVALGVALEFAQRATGYRQFEYYDMAANAVGVALGWLLAPPRLPNWLAIAERIAAPRSP